MNDDTEIAIYTGKQNCFIKHSIPLKPVLYAFLGAIWFFLGFLFFRLNFPLYTIIAESLCILLFLYFISRIPQIDYSWKQAPCTTTFTFNPNELHIELEFSDVKIKSFNEYSCTSNKATNTQEYHFLYERIKKIFWCTEHSCFVICYNELSDTSKDISTDFATSLEFNPYIFFATPSINRTISNLFIEHTNSYVQNAPLSIIHKEFHM